MDVHVPACCQVLAIDTTAINGMFSIGSNLWYVLYVIDSAGIALIAAMKGLPNTDSS